jgi:hypothetical protein
VIVFTVSARDGLPALVAVTVPVWDPPSGANSPTLTRTVSVCVAPGVSAGVV